MSKDRRLIYQINQAKHIMMKSMDQDIRSRLGISVVQFTTLLALKKSNDCQMKDLARMLMLDKSAITGLVQRMIKENLVEKTVCKTDSRASQIRLTSKGRQMIDRGKPLIKQANALICEGFNEEELDTVSRFLNHITDIFSERS